MKILLTNDDGVQAPGLWALYDQFSKSHEVYVVAPDRERSAVGHGITLHSPLRVLKIAQNGCSNAYAVTGTPADCIKLSVIEILKDKPDLVISGINPGANVGVNINYSGTVAAAKEAALYGIKSMAVSIQAPVKDNFEPAAEFTFRLSHQVLKKGLPFGTFLNVNLPNRPFTEIQGVCISQQGIDFFAEYVKKGTDPRNQAYYWHGCDPEVEYDDPNIDSQAICNNYISITPIKCDMTDYQMMDDLKTWEF